MDNDVHRQKSLLGILNVLGSRTRGVVTNILGWSRLEGCDPLLHGFQKCPLSVMLDGDAE
jgi:hypothetical protein